MADETSWDSCPAGTLTEWVANRQARRRAKKAGYVAAAGSAAGMALLVLVFAVTSKPANDRGLSCQEVRNLSDEFAEGSLGRSKRLAVEAHLSECPHCADQYRQRGILPASLQGAGCPDPARGPLARWSPQNLPRSGRAADLVVAAVRDLL